MNFQELQIALKTATSLKIEGGQVRIGQDSLDKTFPPEILTPLYGEVGIEIVSVQHSVEMSRRVVINGRTSFPELKDPAEGLANPLLKNPVEVAVTFELNENETLGVTLAYKLPENWRFSDSFPEIDPFSDENSQSLALDGFKLKDSYFYLTTHDHKLDVTGVSVSLEKGLNFVGSWDPDGVLGLLERPGAHSLYGPVNLSPDNLVGTMDEEQFPWDSPDRNLIRGIYLRADLGLTLSFPPGRGDSTSGIALSNLGFRIYTPLTWSLWSYEMSHGPSMAYVGDLGTSGDKLASVSIAKRSRSEDELVIAADFVSLTPEKLVRVFEQLAGGDDTKNVFPADSKIATDGLGLRRASMTLLRSDRGYEVGSTEFTLGMGASAPAWSPFGEPYNNLIRIGFGALRISVARPFESERRAFFAEIEGTAGFLGGKSGDGVELDVKVRYPGFYISAEQQGIYRIDLGRFEKQGMCLPKFLSFDFEIADIAMFAEPGSNYSFSMNLAPGKSWKIGEKYSLPRLGLAVSCSTEEGGPYLDWHFEAGTKEVVEAVPVVELIRQLSREVADFDMPIEKLPQAIKGLAVTKAALSYFAKGEVFAFECRGTLPLAENRPLDFCFTIEIRKEPGTVRFGGELILFPTPDEPLSFKLQFETGQQGGLAFTGIATGRVRLLGIMTCLASKLGFEVRDFPDSLDATLTSLSLYCHTGEKHLVLSAATESGSAFVLSIKCLPGTPSRYLFGVDVEGGLNLSNVKLSDFPLISQFAPPPDQTLKLAVQVVGTNALFTVEEVAALNALNPSGLRLPNKAIDKLAVAASLRLGQEVKQLSLPISVKPQGVSASSDQEGTNSLSPQSDQSAVHGPTSSTAQAVSDDGMQWMMIQKTYPPVHFERVGIAYKDNRIKGELDAALSVGGLTIALDGLSVTSPLTKLAPEFSLRGLGIDYRNGPLEIGGAFLKQTRTEGNATYTSFAGLAVLRTKALTLSAIGSYALKDGHPSLFIYAVLDYPLGGPAFFFVTGLAAGFGYNRALSIPTIEQVESFPLVQQAMGAPESSTARALPADQKEQQNLLTERLESLEGYIPRAVGEHFLAIGVSFTSFKTVNSFALLTLKFGAEFEIDLLGLSTLNVPNVAFAQLALKATFKPQAGFLEVRAQLTPRSYLLSERCHLTGGFAFLCWFQGDKKLGIAEGDFVLTLGGYHPLYKPPAHYPRLPRLGFDWQVDDYLHLKGDAYYAMVPHALMAGCHLEATWHKDQLKAWFTAGADFLICWQPYHYDAKIYVDLGASYTFDFFGSHTVTVDLGADLHLWGPEFAGEAHIHWWIISFTVNFGKTTPQGIEPIPWEGFKSAFLPAKSQVCGITLQQGLIRQIQQDGKDYWIVNPKDFVLVTNSVIPSTASKTGSKEIDAMTFKAAVRPMGAETITSTHTITILYPGSKDDDKKRFKFTSVKKSVPAAMWGTPEFTDDNNKKFLKPPNVNEKDSLIENTLAGFEIRPVDAKPGKSTPFVPTPYDTEPMPDAWTWEQWMFSASDFNRRGTAAWTAAANNTDRIESSTRNRLLQALGFANSAN